MAAATNPATMPHVVPEAPKKPEKETVVKAVEAIEAGPRVLRIYMEECAKCGTCAEVCPVYYGEPDKRMNPADRADLIRRIYKHRTTFSGKLLGRLAGAQDYAEGEIYGLEHTPARFRERALKPRTGLKGFYLTGQDVCTAGIAGALFGGTIAASAILGKNLLGEISRRNG